jgi:hypothetical protein
MVVPQGKKEEVLTILATGRITTQVVAAHQVLKARTCGHHLHHSGCGADG